MEQLSVFSNLAPAEFRQVVDYINRLVAEFNSKVTTLTTELDDANNEILDLQDDLVICDDGSGGFSAVTEESGSYVSFDEIASVVLGLVQVAATYTVLPSDNIILATGTFTVTLPTAVGNIGRMVAVKNIGTGTVTVDGAGAELVDGSANIALIQDETIILISEGLGWRIM